MKLREVLLENLYSSLLLMNYINNGKCGSLWLFVSKDGSHQIKSFDTLTELSMRKNDEVRTSRINSIFALISEVAKVLKGVKKEKPSILMISPLE